jgi:hypothetical protein
MTTSRVELLRLIAELSEAAPDLRLGQMLTNLATLARGAQIESIWDAEDEELTAACRRLLDHYRQRDSVMA